jgi:hypothetical protein
MPTVYVGTGDEPGCELEPSRDLIAVRTRSVRSIARSIGPAPTPRKETRAWERKYEHFSVL